MTNPLNLSDRFLSNASEHIRDHSSGKYKVSFKPNPFLNGFIYEVWERGDLSTHRVVRDLDGSKWGRFDTSRTSFSSEKSDRIITETFPTAKEGVKICKGKRLIVMVPSHMLNPSFDKLC